MSTRVPSIDILRGLVMVLMALDHVRDFFSAARFDPLDLTQTTAPLFLTRWITHFCAPTFVLLAGVSAYLTGQRCTRAQLAGFLFTRGLWLVVLEATLMSLAWTFNVRYDHGLFLQVIWAIGVSMIVLAALIHLPLRAIAIFSVAMIVVHNALDGIDPRSFGTWAPLWSVLHVPGPIPHAYVSYPLIPWIAVMSLGYCIGTVFDLQPPQRGSHLLYLGAASLTAFVLLRMPNAYGNPSDWKLQSSTLRTLLSFVDDDLLALPPQWVFGLPIVYLAWLLVVATLYPACRWFAAVKRRRSDWWLSYL